MIEVQPRRHVVLEFARYLDRFAKFVRRDPRKEKAEDIGATTRKMG